MYSETVAVSGAQIPGAAQALGRFVLLACESFTVLLLLHTRRLSIVYYSPVLLYKSKLRLELVGGGVNLTT